MRSGETGGAVVTILAAETGELSKGSPLPPALQPSTAAPASTDGGYDLAAAVAREAESLAALRPRLARRLKEVEAGEVFQLSQGLVLAAAVRDLRPDVILDLGTGRGASATALASADPSVPVHTFDLEPQWEQRIAFLLGEAYPNVHPVVADLATVDFAPLVATAERVLVFWDAHGFGIAARVFSHLMPLIADKPHLVVCHDVADARYKFDETHGLPYFGRRMWRGSDDYFDRFDTTAPVRIGWLYSGMDQAISLLDFTGRNRMTLESAEHRLREAPEPTRSAAMAVFRPGDLPLDLAYFTMNETPLRHFPAG